MTSTAKKILLGAAALLLVGQGCVKVQTAPKTSDGGVFRSADKGATWQQKSAIAAVGQGRTFAGLNVSALETDPSDRKALYAGTPDSGLFFSYDAGESWQHAAALGRVPVNAIAIHPADKCTVFVATANRVVRTTDCSRSWENAYFDSRVDARVTRALFDRANPSVLYAATSKGDLLRSSDTGASWSPLRRFESEIAQVLQSSSDPKVFFVATRQKGLWRSTDGGGTWTDLSKNFGQFKGALDKMLLAEDPSKPNGLIAASQYGLLRTADVGDTWTALTLLTPPGSTVIYSLAVSPKDANAIYYGTGSALYRSVDGGVKWVAAKLPTSRAATILMIDPSNDSTIYMGTTLFEQKSGF